jgi:hypothetical protein
MFDERKDGYFHQVEWEGKRMGGGAKRGTITPRELERAQEIRVSIRPPTSIGSTELFTLRNLEPGAYHLILLAIPRNDDCEELEIEQI